MFIADTKGVEEGKRGKRRRKGEEEVGGRGREEREKRIREGEGMKSEERRKGTND